MRRVTAADKRLGSKRIVWVCGIVCGGWFGQERGESSSGGLAGDEVRNLESRHGRDDEGGLLLEYVHRGPKEP